jgi:hypothetical protein
MVYDMQQVINKIKEKHNMKFYIVINDSSTFCQNFRACLKSCSEMPAYGKHLL